jgi:hypothetical protein
MSERRVGAVKRPEAAAVAVRRRAFAIGAAAASAAALVAPASCAADTLLSAASPRHDFAVAGDATLWSVRSGARGYRLMMLRAGVLRVLALPRNAPPFWPSAGTDRRGRTVIVYARCSPSRRCDSIYEVAVPSGRAHRLALTPGRGCELGAPSIDRGAVAFLRSGSCDKAGVWLRHASGRAERISVDSDVCCVAQTNGYTAWMGRPDGAGAVVLSVRGPHGTRYQLFRIDDTYSLEAVTGTLHAFDGRWYWSVVAYDRGVMASARVYRTALTRGSACEATDRDLAVIATGNPPLFAIAADGLRYVANDGIHLADQPAVTFAAASSPFMQPTVLGKGCWAL